MYKKVTLFVLLVITLASCGTGRKASNKNAASALQDEVIEYGKKYIGKPYRYASKGPNSFDCSGYTSFVFKKFGYNLSPSSSGQDQQVRSIRRKKDLSKGDLVFFEGRSHNGRVGHVGIVTNVKPNGEFEFIHASTSRGVIISKSTEQYYASRYLRGGRVIHDTQVAQAVVKESKQQATKAKRQPKSKRDKRDFNAYEPATAKKESKPREPSVPIIKSEPTSQQPIIIKNEQSAAVAEAIANESESDEIIIVQTDSTKTPELAEREAPNEEQNDSIFTMVTQAIIRPDTLSVPKPVVQEASADSLSAPNTLHTVKPGETFYSISRQYNCTVEQLKQRNPHLGSVLKAGEKLYIHP